MKIAYHSLLDIFQWKMLMTWSHVIKIFCIARNISLQQIKMIISGPSIMDAVMLANYQISCLHEIRAIKILS